MKLCKDCKHCKHALMPNPYGNAASGAVFYYIPMCAHPCAERDAVYGRSVEPCSEARKGGSCGPDAKLFEERPPQPQIVMWSQPMDPHSWGEVDPAGDQRKPWWRRMFGG